MFLNQEIVSDDTKGRSIKKLEVLISRFIFYIYNAKHILKYVHLDWFYISWEFGPKFTFYWDFSFFFSFLHWYFCERPK